MAIFDGLLGFFDRKRPPIPPELSGGAPVPYNPGGNNLPPSIGPAPPGSRPESRYEQLSNARDAYLAGTPGRKKSGLVGALLGGLQGLASGNLAGAIGGAIGGGAYGAINPRGLRENEFNQRIRPKMIEGWQWDEFDTARAMAQAKAREESQLNTARLGQIGAETAEAQARARKLGQPEPPKPPSYSSYGGGIFNTATGEVVPGTAPPKAERPDLVWTENQGRVDASKLTPEERRKLRPYQRPRAPREAKPKTAKKYASITDVRAAAEKAGMTESQMSAQFKAAGYEIVR